jgi:hypothetical protein
MVVKVMKRLRIMLEKGAIIERISFDLINLDNLQKLCHPNNSSTLLPRDNGVYGDICR